MSTPRKTPTWHMINLVLEKQDRLQLDLSTVDPHRFARTARIVENRTVYGRPTSGREGSLSRRLRELRRLDIFVH